MTTDPLIPGCEPTPPARRAVPQGVARVQTAQRNQMALGCELDALVGPDHRARLVWDFVKGLDLSAFYAQVRAVEGYAGRPPIDPAILLSLWLFATLEAVGSARALAKLCQEHDAYRWICGGVGVNHHTLSDFRSGHGEKLDDLLTESVAALIATGVVTLDRVAQDGVKVRAAAGTSSFHRRPTLDRCLEEAEAHVKALACELDDDPAATTARQRAARERAARERVERVREAIRQREEAAKRREGAQEKEGTRGSTTDPEARMMKLGNGGISPAFNAQFATDVDTQLIVGVDVVNRGTDHGQLAPMLEQIEGRFGCRPRNVLVDAGFLSHREIEEMAAAGTTTYGPVSAGRWKGDRYAARPGESPVLTQWRTRMGSTEGREAYKARAATAECINATARNRGLRQFLTRGVERARAVVLLFALAHNLLRVASLKI